MVKLAQLLGLHDRRGDRGGAELHEERPSEGQRSSKPLLKHILRSLKTSSSAPSSPTVRQSGQVNTDVPSTAATSVALPTASTANLEASEQGPTYQPPAANVGCSAAPVLPHAETTTTRPNDHQEEGEAPTTKYDSWDRYLSNGRSFCFMTTECDDEEENGDAEDTDHPALRQDSVPSATLYAAAHHIYDTNDSGTHRGDGATSASDISHREGRGTASGFTSDAGPLGRHDAGGHLLASLDAHGSADAASRGPNGPLPALITLPGVNLSIDYASEIQLSDGAPIGQGQFGSVFRGLYRGQHVAVKMLPKWVGVGVWGRG